MRAKQRWCYLLVLLVMMGVSACTPQPAQPGEAPANKDGPLRLALIPVTDVIPFYVAEAEGFFGEEGVQVELVPVASAADRDTMIQNGEVDGELNDLISTVLTNAQGKEQVRVVRQSRIAYSDRPQFYILSAPDSGINELEALKGQTIGVSDNSVIAYVTDRLLQTQGFTQDEIVTTPIPDIQARFQALINNETPAATLPDPLASLAVLQGASILLTDSNNPDVSQSVISFRTEVLASRADEVAALFRAYDRAVEAINADPDAYQNILIANSRVPEPLQDRYKLPRFPESTITSEAEFADVVQWALDKGLIPTPLTYEQLVDTSFVGTPGED